MAARFPGNRTQDRDEKLYRKEIILIFLICLKQYSEVISLKILSEALLLIKSRYNIPNYSWKIPWSQ